MKKYFFIFIALITITSCEKDDFCEENQATPNLVLRFYDKDNVSLLKKTQRFSVIAQGKTDSLFTNQNIDSIAIPLNSLAQETVYTFKINETDNLAINNKIATLTVQYNPEDDYVSRSCGYRIIFKDVNLEYTNWIDSLSTSKITNINNQSKAHVQVYY